MGSPQFRRVLRSSTGNQTQRVSEKQKRQKEESVEREDGEDKLLLLVKAATDPSAKPASGDGGAPGAP